jgi:hypothetical protein
MLEHLERLVVVDNENLELHREEFRLKEENDRLKKENGGPESLMFYMQRSMVANNRVREHQESALMHYNELQSRSAEVEAMASNFQKVVADEVAKAGLRAKSGPKKKGGNTIRRGKTNHSERNAQENSASKSANPMAPPWSRKKDGKDNLSTAMEL